MGFKEKMMKLMMGNMSSTEKSAMMDKMMGGGSDKGAIACCIPR